MGTWVCNGRKFLGRKNLVPIRKLEAEKSSKRSTLVLEMQYFDDHHIFPLVWFWFGFCSGLEERMEAWQSGVHSFVCFFCYVDVYGF